MAHKRTHIIGSIAIIAAIAAPAAAQDEPRLALVASLPTPTVAIQWEMSDRFAVRVDGSYNYRDESVDRTSAGGSFNDRTTGTIFVNQTLAHTESSTHAGAIGIAGIITIHRGDQLRLYAAPRLGLSFSSQRFTTTTTTTTTPPLPPGGIQISFGPSRDGTETLETSSTSPTAGGSFGAEAGVHRRLAVFGEVGATFGWSDTSLPALPGVVGGVGLARPGESTRTTINTRAVAGVMIRF
jgi:hypothetical protein